MENGRSRFFRRFAEGVFDEADVIARAHELADFVAQAAERYQFDRQQLIAVGYSNGANIAAAILLLRPGTFSAAILFRAMRVLANPPAANLANTRVLLSAGREDPIIPLKNVEQLAGSLREPGSDVTLEIQAAAHGLVARDLAVAKTWLDAA